jgi:hypothetical protein
MKSAKSKRREKWIWQLAKIIRNYWHECDRFRYKAENKPIPALKGVSKADRMMARACAAYHYDEAIEEDGKPISPKDAWDEELDAAR